MYQYLHAYRLRVLCLLAILLILFLFFPRPIVALYGYAPFIYSTSPTPPKSHRLGMRSSIRLECRAAWITGYYATSLSWDEVVAFYTNHGFVRDPDGYALRSYAGQLSRGVGTFRDPRHWENINNPTLRTAIQAAITNQQTVYSFTLYYEENKDIFRQSPCFHD
jgi:hypothetical protein